MRRKLAILGIATDHPDIYHPWISYYLNSIDGKDIHIVNPGLRTYCGAMLNELRKYYGINIISFPEDTDNSIWWFQMQQRMQDVLLCNYECVLWADTSHIIYYDKGSVADIHSLFDEDKAITGMLHRVMRVPGEKEYNISKPILSQRAYWQRGNKMRICVGSSGSYLDYVDNPIVHNSDIWTIDLSEIFNKRKNTKGLTPIPERFSELI
jgi:hypothetical protein